MNENFQWWQVKIDRAAAWTLLATIILFFISGYGMTKGIIDERLASNLHSNILTPIGLIAFSIHTFFAISLSLVRWRKWNSASLASLVLIYSGFIIIFAYIGFFYQKPAAVEGRPAAENNAGNAVAEKTFTAAELAEYNGKNNQPAYIAVDNIVYDVSALFINGQHRGCSAGYDVTAEFYDEHSKQILSGYPTVGKLITK